MKTSKRMKEAEGKIDKNKSYPLAEAVALALETSTVKFDASVEVHFNLNIDPKKGDQQIRTTVTLPHGSGKTKRVAAFVSSDKMDEAKAAGADLVGDEQTIDQIAQKKVIDFDVAVATPSMMPKLAKIAQVLGPKGLMPNPKADTVGENVTKMIQEQKAGKTAFKNDNSSNVHVAIGKVSFGPEKVTENLKTLTRALVKSRPAAVKGVFVKSATVTTSMGPAVKFEIE